MEGKIFHQINHQRHQILIYETSIRGAAESV